MTEPRSPSFTHVPQIGSAEVLDLAFRDDLDLAHRILWLLLFELGPTEIRLADLLALDVPAVDLDARAIVTTISKTGRPVVGKFSDRAAGMLDALIGAHDNGPLFTSRSGQRLSEVLAFEYFRSVTGGQSLHALRFNGQRHATA
ncbi:tyrosine-type recombinase/integrase [Streptomyces sp. NPDC051597]|uniref:tyrosine-type recombinase/integrase n=1 Tax=Streptomyces sp. NPDC051597 TaxID=3155049 RepID=UPI00341F5735